MPPMRSSRNTLTSQRTAVREWREAFQQLEAARRVQAEAESIQKRLHEGEANAKTLDVSLKSVRETLTTQRTEHERVTQACDQQRRVVEQAQQAASFDEHRHDLKSGEPCPLRGALEHPFASGEISFTSQLQTARKLLATLEQQRDKLAREVATSQNEVTRQEERLRGETDKIAEAQRALAKLVVPDVATLQTAEAAKRSAAQSSSVAPQLKGEPVAAQLGYFASPNDAEIHLNALEKRAHTFATKQSEATTQRAKHQQFETALQLATQDLDAKTKRLNELKAEGIALKSKADTLKQLIVSLLGERTLTQDREWHEQQVAAAEKAARVHEAKAHDLQTKAASTRARREQLDVRVNELAAQLANREPVTAAMIAELEQTARRMSDELATRQKSAGIFEERLRSDDAARQRRDTGGAELQAAEAEALRWGRLKELIGSADGAKFSRFAQSLTLRQLIGLADNHLAVLAERYRLMAADGDELDLRIVDLYQANVEPPNGELVRRREFPGKSRARIGLERAGEPTSSHRLALH